MLVRLVTFACVVVAAVAGSLLASPQEDILGTWSQDRAPNLTRITFSLDHTFTMAAGGDQNSLHTYITGTWGIKEGDLLLAHMEAAGKPLSDPECRKQIIAISKTKLVFENESYTRVR